MTKQLGTQLSGHSTAAMDAEQTLFRKFTTRIITPSSFLKHDFSSQGIILLRDLMLTKRIGSSSTFERRKEIIYINLAWGMEKVEINELVKNPV